MVKWLSRLLVMSVCAGVAPAVWAQAAQQAQTPQPQTPADPSEIDKTACGTPVGAPAALPPAGSPPFIWIFELCFARQGGSSTVENETKTIPELKRSVDKLEVTAARLSGQVELLAQRLPLK